MNIPFNRPHLVGKEIEYLMEAYASGKLAGDGIFTEKCNEWLKNLTRSHKVLLTHSCTAALEMAAILFNIGPGDEVIMPSYTFVSTANAFVLRGATPVFVDIRPDTLNLDERLIEEAITKKTKAIVPIHYGGIAAEMGEIMDIAKRHGLMVVEDAAQGLMAAYKGVPLGSIAHLGAYSFHETKNVISGEGGALVVNEPEFVQRAEIVREKGTNRSRFFRGEVDKYTWEDIGSSFLPGEIVAAFLWAQLQVAQNITLERLRLWRIYHDAFANLENRAILRRPIVPEWCSHNGHLYYVILSDVNERTRVLQALKDDGIHAVFHYIPLHSSPAGRRYGRAAGDLAVTDSVSVRLIRLPLWFGMNKDAQEKVIDTLQRALA